MALDDPTLLTKWSVSRDCKRSNLAALIDLAAAVAYPGEFAGFQAMLQGTVHGGTHMAVGGNMAGSSSPTDPLFWLHHTFIDKAEQIGKLLQMGKTPQHQRNIEINRN